MKAATATVEIAVAMMSRVAATEMAATEVEVEIGGLPGLDGMVELVFGAGHHSIIFDSTLPQPSRYGLRGSEYMFPVPSVPPPPCDDPNPANAQTQE